MPEDNPDQYDAVPLGSLFLDKPLGAIWMQQHLDAARALLDDEVLQHFGMTWQHMEQIAVSSGHCDFKMGLVPSIADNWHIIDDATATVFDLCHNRHDFLRAFTFRITDVVVTLDDAVVGVLVNAIYLFVPLPRQDRVKQHLGTLYALFLQSQGLVSWQLVLLFDGRVFCRLLQLCIEVLSHKTHRLLNVFGLGHVESFVRTQVFMFVAQQGV